MQDIVIFGAGALGREAAWLVERSNQVRQEWNLLGFLDETPGYSGKLVNGYPVLGGMEWLEGRQEPIGVICAFGSPSAKKAVSGRLSAFKCVFHPVVRDPQAIVSSSAEIGGGSLLFPGCIVSVNVKIGQHVLVYFNTVVTHDNVIGDYCSINPSASLAGNVSVGAGTLVGLGASVIERQTIGEQAVVGAGAVVIRPVKSGTTVAGCPAREIPRRGS